MHRTLPVPLLSAALVVLTLSGWVPCVRAQAVTVASQPSDQTTSRPPFPFTPAHLERAWQEAGTRQSLLVLGAGLAASVAIYPLDDEISDRFYQQKPLGPDAHNIGAQMGHRKYVALMSAGLIASGQLIGNRRIRDTGFLYAESNLITAGLNTLLKKGVGRVRPDGSNDKSFPSGHASSSMASARVLQARFGWWVGAPAYLASGYIGLSRVQGKKHFPSDVIFGWVLGFTVSSALVRASEPRPGEEGFEKSGVSWLPPPDPQDMGLALLRVRF